MMDKNQVLYARAELEAHVLMAARRHLGTTEIDVREEQNKQRIFDIFNYKEDMRDAIAHLLFCLEKIRDFIAEERLEKAMRWLSFVQGCAWMLGVLSIHHSQEQNRKH
jgi:hypothetical protein